jgi:hypothetical protein
MLAERSRTTTPLFAPFASAASLEPTLWDSRAANATTTTSAIASAMRTIVVRRAGSLRRSASTSGIA